MSQLSDDDYDIIFNQRSCKVISQQDGPVMFHGGRKNNIYKINKDSVKFLLSIKRSGYDIETYEKTA